MLITFRPGHFSNSSDMGDISVNRTYLKTMYSERPAEGASSYIYHNLQASESPRTSLFYLHNDSELTPPPSDHCRMQSNLPAFFKFTIFAMLMTNTAAVVALPEPMDLVTRQDTCFASICTPGSTDECCPGTTCTSANLLTIKVIGVSFEACSSSPYGLDVDVMKDRPGRISSVYCTDPFPTSSYS